MHYTHLSAEERFTLQRLDVQGKSYRYMALVLGRHPSTIAREFKRNRPRGPYVYSEAHEVAFARKSHAHQRPRLKDPDLRAHVQARIQEGDSPELIAGRLKEQRSARTISHEAIYQWLYQERTDLCVHLCRKHKSRYPRGYTRKTLTPVIPLRVCITKRPQQVAQRKVPGHWETDTMSGTRQHAHALLVSVERLTRYTRIDRLKNRSPKAVHRSLHAFFLKVPKRLRRSITYDNGFENRDHWKLNNTFGMKSYFCLPFHSWEKGTVENTIGLIRRYIPKGTDLATLSPKQIQQIEDRLNNRPRKCLNYKTPKELFHAVALNG
jgi:IS30 family transposase